MQVVGVCDFPFGLRGLDRTWASFSIIITIISYRFLNVEVPPVVLSNSEYHFSAVFSNMYLRNKKMYIMYGLRIC